MKTDAADLQAQDAVIAVREDPPYASDRESRNQPRLSFPSVHIDRSVPDPELEGNRMPNHPFNGRQTDRHPSRSPELPHPLDLRCRVRTGCDVHSSHRNLHHSQGKFRFMFNSGIRQFCGS
jgi:hypothetical protein